MSYLLNKDRFDANCDQLSLFFGVVFASAAITNIITNAIFGTQCTPFHDIRIIIRTIFSTIFHLISIIIHDIEYIIWGDIKHEQISLLKHLTSYDWFKNTTVLNYLKLHNSILELGYLSKITNEYDYLNGLYNNILVKHLKLFVGLKYHYIAEKLFTDKFESLFTNIIDDENNEYHNVVTNIRERRNTINCLFSTIKKIISILYIETIEHTGALFADRNFKNQNCELDSDEISTILNYNIISPSGITECCTYDLNCECSCNWSCECSCMKFSKYTTDEEIYETADDDDNVDRREERIVDRVLVDLKIKKTYKNLKKIINNTLDSNNYYNVYNANELKRFFVKNQNSFAELFTHKRVKKEMMNFINDNLFKYNYFIQVNSGNSCNEFCDNKNDIWKVNKS